MLTAAQVLAVNNFGDTRTGGLAGPMGLFLIVLLAIATVLLIRNMNTRLRRLPDRFPDQRRRRAGRTGRCRPFRSRPRRTVGRGISMEALPGLPTCTERPIGGMIRGQTRRPPPVAPNRFGLAFRRGTKSPRTVRGRGRR